MDDKIDAIIRVKVPKWQIGEEVSVYFPDTMMTRGKCETMPPQVTVFAEDASEQAIVDGKTNFPRPQGEWTNTSPYDIKGKCSLCCYLSNKCYNFCPNCGADMRKGNAE